MVSPTQTLKFHVMVIVYGVDVKGAKDRRSKHIKVGRILDYLANRWESIKNWILIAPGVYVTEGKVSISLAKKIREYIIEKLGKEVIVLVTKHVTEMTKDIEVMRKTEREHELEVMGTKYVSEVREFGGSYYISLPKSIAKTIGVKKGSKVIVRVAKA